MEQENERMKCWYLIDTTCDRPPGICEGCERYEDWRKESERVTERKSCPFCDGSPKLESDTHRKEFGRDRFRIVCSSCYAGTRWYDSPDEAWLMWDGRVGK
jgi:hypothetical protein